MSPSMVPKAVCAARSAVPPTWMPYPPAMFDETMYIGKDLTCPLEVQLVVLV